MNKPYRGPVNKCHAIQFEMSDGLGKERESDCVAINDAVFDGELFQLATPQSNAGDDGLGQHGTLGLLRPRHGFGADDGE